MTATWLLRWMLVHKLSQLHETLILGGKALVGISPNGMGLMFSHIHPGSISDFNITEKNSM